MTTNRTTTALAVALAAGCTGCAAAQYGGSGGALNDAGNAPGVTTFTITVLDEGTVGTFGKLTLANLQHSWCGDLKITLTAPDASSVSIVDRIGYPGSLFGDSSNFLGTYAFADGGSDLWALATQQGNGSAYNIASGTYGATGSGGAAVALAAFLEGRNAHGLWTLTITDAESGDVGSLGGWSLDMTVVPAPGVLAAMAPLAALGRRRRSNR